MVNTYVIARHSEQLAWTTKLKGNIYIYDSGGPVAFKHIHERTRSRVRTYFVRGSFRDLILLKDEADNGVQLEFNEAATVVHVRNDAKEVSKWLQFIVDHYPDFGEMNIFLQGYPFDHIDLEKEVANMNLELGYGFLGAGVCSSDIYPGGTTEQEQDAIVNEIYEGNAPQISSWQPGAQFYITNKWLTRNTKSYYEMLM